MPKVALAGVNPESGEPTVGQLLQVVRFKLWQPLVDQENPRASSLGEVGEVDQEGTTGLIGPDARGDLVAGLSVHRRNVLEDTRDCSALGGVENFVADVEKLAKDVRTRVVPSPAF